MVMTRGEEPSAENGSVLRVLVADDDEMMRETLSDLIGDQASLELVALAENAEQAIELAGLEQPDVAILDVKMPGGGARAAREIRACSPATAIIALSAHEDESSVKEMLAAGASSYLVKGASSREVLDAIRASVRGGATLSEAIASQVVSELSARLQRERRRQSHREHWEGRIRRVLSGEDELLTVYQPIVELGSRRVVGVEALSRFTSEPVKSPDVWFAEAAVAGLSLSLEIAAVETAISSLDRLPDGVDLALNVSPDAVMSPRLGGVLDAFRPESIILEVTEHAPIRDYPRLGAALMFLRGCGVRLAVDDAGAGYASLRHIIQLQPDLIKLDISLTRDIDVDPPRRALAAALVTFAREIDARIIAEGIETPAELHVLEDLGVTLGQGFYLGEPGPLAGLFGDADVVQMRPGTRGDERLAAEG